MSGGDFLAPMAMIGGAVFMEMARVGATVITGRFLAGCVGVHPGGGAVSCGGGGGGALNAVKAVLRPLVLKK